MYSAEMKKVLKLGMVLVLVLAQVQSAPSPDLTFNGNGFEFTTGNIPVVSGKCSTECGVSGLDKLHYLVGKTYSYSYSGSSNVGLVSRPEHVALTWHAKVDLIFTSPCEVLMKVYDGKIIGLQDQNLAKALSKHDMMIAFNEGLIGRVCVSPDEDPVALNVKKGIVSQLQNSLPSFSKIYSDTSIMEIDSTGICPTVYKVEKNGITTVVSKSKDHKLCTERLAKSSWSFASFLYQKDPMNIFQGMTECRQEIEFGIIKESDCTDIKRFYLVANQYSVTTQHSRLVLAGITTAPVVDTNRFYKRTSLLFETGPVRPQKELIPVAEGLLRKISGKTGHGIEKEVPELVADLISTLNKVPHDTIQQLHRKIQDGKFATSRGASRDVDGSHSQEREVKHLEGIYLDSVAFVDQPGVIKLIVDQVRSGRVSGMRTFYYILSLFTMRNTSLKTIQELIPLFEDVSNSVPSSYHLAAAYQINRYCTSYNDQCLMEIPMTQIMEKLMSNLKKTCSGSSTHEVLRQDALRNLKIIGNIGLMTSEQRDIVMKECILPRKLVDVSVRIAAVQSYRMLKCEKSQVHNPLDVIPRMRNENTEVRMAAFQATLPCISYSDLESLMTVLFHDPNREVVAFIYQYLKEIQTSKEPYNKDIAAKISQLKIPDINIKTERLATFHHLGYVRKTIIPFGAWFDYDKVLTQTKKTPGAKYIRPLSFLQAPNQINGNATLDIQNVFLNLMDFGLRMENVQHIIDILESGQRINFDPSKSIVENLVHVFKNVLQIGKKAQFRSFVGDLYKKKTQVEFFLRMFKHELGYFSLSKNTADINKLTYDQIADEVNSIFVKWASSLSFKQFNATRVFQFRDNGILPTIQGIPIQLEGITTIVGGLDMRGRFPQALFDYKPGNCSITPGIVTKSSIFVGYNLKGKVGMQMVTEVHSSPRLKINFEYGQGSMKGYLSPMNKVDLLEYSSAVYVIKKSPNMKEIIIPEKGADREPRIKHVTCHPIHRHFGPLFIDVKGCFDVNIPNFFMSDVAPFGKPAVLKFSLTTKNQWNSFKEGFEVSYKHKNDKISDKYQIFYGVRGLVDQKYPGFEFEYVKNPQDKLESHGKRGVNDLPTRSGIKILLKNFNKETTNKCAVEIYSQESKIMSMEYRGTGLLSYLIRSKKPFTHVEAHTNGWLKKYVDFDLEFDDNPGVNLERDHISQDTHVTSKMLVRFGSGKFQTLTTLLQQQSKRSIVFEESQTVADRNIRYYAKNLYSYRNPKVLVDIYENNQSQIRNEDGPNDYNQQKYGQNDYDQLKNGQNDYNQQKYGENQEKTITQYKLMWSKSSELDSTIESQREIHSMVETGNTLSESLNLRNSLFLVSAEINFDPENPQWSDWKLQGIRGGGKHLTYNYERDSNAKTFNVLLRLDNYPGASTDALVLGAYSKKSDEQTSSQYGLQIAVPGVVSDYKMEGEVHWFHPAKAKLIATLQNNDIRIFTVDGLISASNSSQSSIYHSSLQLSGPSDHLYQLETTYDAEAIQVKIDTKLTAYQTRLYISDNPLFQSSIQYNRHHLNQLSGNINLNFPTVITGKVSGESNSKEFKVLSDLLIIPDRDDKRRVKSFTGVKFDEKTILAKVHYDYDRDESKELYVNAYYDYSVENRMIVLNGHAGATSEEYKKLLSNSSQLYLSTSIYLDAPNAVNPKRHLEFEFSKANDNIVKLELLFHDNVLDHTMGDINALVDVTLYKDRYKVGGDMCYVDNDEMQDVQYAGTVNLALPWLKEVVLEFDTKAKDNGEENHFLTKIHLYSYYGEESLKTLLEYKAFEKEAYAGLLLGKSITQGSLLIPKDPRKDTDYKKSIFNFQVTAKPSQTSEIYGIDIKKQEEGDFKVSFSRNSDETVQFQLLKPGQKDWMMRLTAPDAEVELSSEIGPQEMSMSLYPNKDWSMAKYDSGSPPWGKHHSHAHTSLKNSHLQTNLQLVEQDLGYNNEIESKNLLALLNVAVQQTAMTGELNLTLSPGNNEKILVSIMETALTDGSKTYEVIFNSKSLKSSPRFLVDTADTPSFKSVHLAFKEDSSKPPLVTLSSSYENNQEHGLPSMIYAAVVTPINDIELQAVIEGEDIRNMKINGSLLSSQNKVTTAYDFQTLFNYPKYVKFGANQRSSKERYTGELGMKREVACATIFKEALRYHGKELGEGTSLDNKETSILSTALELWTPSILSFTSHYDIKELNSFFMDHILTSIDNAVKTFTITTTQIVDEIMLKPFEEDKKSMRGRIDAMIRGIESVINRIVKDIEKEKPKMGHWKKEVKAALERLQKYYKSLSEQMHRQLELAVSRVSHTIFGDYDRLDRDIKNALSRLVNDFSNTTAKLNHYVNDLQTDSLKSILKSTNIVPLADRMEENVKNILGQDTKYVERAFNYSVILLKEELRILEERLDHSWPLRIVLDWSRNFGKTSSRPLDNLLSNLFQISVSTERGSLGIKLPLSRPTYNIRSSINNIGIPKYFWNTILEYSEK